MNYCTRTKISKLLLLAYLAVGFGGQSLVYANIDATNQCAKLFESQNQTLSFEQLIKQKVRAAQDAQSKSAAAQKAEEDKRKEEERQKREALEQANLGYKIQFLEIPPSKFIMGEGEEAKEVEITKAYGIMDKKMTQLMYARLQELMGYKEIRHLFPSHFTDGDNSIMYDYNETKVPMRPDDPVTNISWDDINDRFIPKLNELSKSEDPNIQSLLKKIIPNHQKGDVYDFVTEAQIENVMKLAKTADGDTIDAMIAREDHEKLKKYVVYDQNSNSNIGTYPEASLLPLFIDGKPIYLHGNVWEWTKDHWDSSAPLIGGKDPLSTIGWLRSARGGCWFRTAAHLRSVLRYVGDPDSRHPFFGFRLARVSRVSDVIFGKDLAQHEPKSSSVSKIKNHITVIYKKIRGMP